ncbi:MAG: DUF4397 domain-containing protein [Gemmatimonadales bacterium]
MRSYSRWALGTALAFGAACTPKDSAVTTTTDQGTTASASGEAAAQRDHSMIRLINAVPDGPKMTLLADERTMFNNVAGSEVTSYKELLDNAVKFSVRRSDQPSAAGEGVNREMMGDGQRYTAVVLPDVKGKTSGLRVLHDELTPAEGKARIRVINAASGAGDLDVVLTGRKGQLFSGINFGNEAGFKDIDPVAGTLEVRRENEQLMLTSIRGMKLEAGTAYTVVIVGGPKAPLKTITFEDRATPAHPVVSMNP